MGLPVTIAYHRLPVTALEKIFSYLNPIDRAQASCVCKSWNEAYSSPSLWIAPVFKFNKPDNRKPRFDPRPTILKHGAFFRKLTIICKRKPNATRKFLEKQIAHFLAEMTDHGVQVQSLRMPSWCIVTKFGEEGWLIKQLTEFLKAQKALKIVDFTNARALNPCGIKTLESLCPDNVEHLHLHNFFLADNVLFGRGSRFDDAMCGFRGLRTLSINYKYVSVTFLSSLAENLHGRLELLSILCVLHRGIDYVIPENSWAELTRALPDLSVNFCLDVKNMPTEDIVERNILSGFMRLEGFQFRLRSSWSILDYGILDDVSRTFSSTLKNVELILHGVVETCINRGIVCFVSRCTNLEKLTLQALFHGYNFEELFWGLLVLLREKEYQHEPLSLKEFRITLKGLAPENREMAVSRRHHYKEQFQMLGLKFHFMVKP